MAPPRAVLADLGARSRSVRSGSFPPVFRTPDPRRRALEAGLSTSESGAGTPQLWARSSRAGSLETCGPSRVDRGSSRPSRRRSPGSKTLQISRRERSRRRPSRWMRDVPIPGASKRIPDRSSWTRILVSPWDLRAWMLRWIHRAAPFGSPPYSPSRQGRLFPHGACTLEGSSTPNRTAVARECGDRANSALTCEVPISHFLGRRAGAPLRTSRSPKRRAGAGGGLVDGMEVRVQRQISETGNSRRRTSNRAPRVDECLLARGAAREGMDSPLTGNRSPK